MPHLFVDISSHGFGHLAQAAPVLNHLAALLPELRITLRSGLPCGKLQQRIQASFQHIAAASDFGYVMIDALSIDRPATAAAYQSAHADFAGRIAEDAALLRHLSADAVFTDVSYLPLAAAAHAGLAAVSLCSLNWADLFSHYFGHEDWAAPIHAEMLAAYRAATFLRTTPGMPMPALDKRVTIAPIAQLGRERRSELREKVGVGRTARLVVIALGGIPARLPIETWPALPDTHWLIPDAWQVARADCHTIEALDWPFVDLLRSVDTVITKPGYGIVSDCLANRTPVLYTSRGEFAEYACLVEGLERYGVSPALSFALRGSGGESAADRLVT